MRIIIGSLFLISSVALASDPEAPKLEQGKKLYAAACSTCHAPDKAKALNAPIAFDHDSWAPHLKNAAVEAANHPEYTNPYDYLLHSVKTGKGLMAHGGLCKEKPEIQALCNDKTYLEAIRYMTSSR